MNKKPQTYTVVIEETLRREIRIPADSPRDAWDQVYSLYMLDRIELSGDDWKDTRIDVAGYPELH